MIIVLLLLFQSICLYCQRIVLYVHDRWINPKNVRILKEVAEATGTRFNPLQPTAADKKVKKRSQLGLDSDTQQENCRFCANSPQGYCRHHFHLQELQVQKQQQKQKRTQQAAIWKPSLIGCGAFNANDGINEYRQLRKIKRELKRNLKNRCIATHPQQKHQQQQQQQEQQYYYQNYAFTRNAYPTATPTTTSTIETEELNAAVNAERSDSGYISNSNTAANPPSNSALQDKHFMHSGIEVAPEAYANGVSSESFITTTTNASIATAVNAPLTPQTADYNSSATTYSVEQNYFFSMD